MLHNVLHDDVSSVAANDFEEFTFGNYKVSSVSAYSDVQYVRAKCLPSKEVCRTHLAAGSI